MISLSSGCRMDITTDMDEKSPTFPTKSPRSMLFEETGSPTKCRRTMSSEETAQAVTAEMPDKADPNAIPGFSNDVPVDCPTAKSIVEDHPTLPAKDSEPQENNNILDILMQHFEAVSSPMEQPNHPSSDALPTTQLFAQGQSMHAVEEPQEKVLPSSHTLNDQTEVADDELRPTQSEEVKITNIASHGPTIETLPVVAPQEQLSWASMAPIPTNPAHQQEEVLMQASTIPGINAQTSALTDLASQKDGIPAQDSLIPNANTEGAEWEADSSPYVTSTDTDSSSEASSSDDKNNDEDESNDSDDSDDSEEDDDSDDDEDEDGDYPMLDPEQQAKILMQGDGGSDDEGGKAKGQGESAALRTANERPEEVIPKPDITVTEDMKVQELGAVEAVVENTVLIRAKVSGEYQVLGSGSLLCLEDRRVIGVISETMGRVEQPLYTMRFTNQEAIEAAGVATSGTIIYYVVPHSTVVFTQPLRGIKGSDASNFHDEEVGDDEMEFSDDEAEAEHKRQMKQKRQGQRDDFSRAEVDEDEEEAAEETASCHSQSRVAPTQMDR